MRHLLFLMVSIFIFTLGLCFGANGNIVFRPLENDTTIRTGELSFGPKYFIKTNKIEKRQISFDKKIAESEDREKIAIIAVGDINVDSLEATFKSKYHNIFDLAEFRIPSRRRDRYTKPDPWDLQYCLTDLADEERKTTKILYNEMILTMVADMLNVRLLRKRETMDNCPYHKAEFAFPSELNGKDRESLCMRITPVKGVDAIYAKAIAREVVEETLTNPFTDLEFDYARQQYFLALERNYKNKDKYTDAAYLWRISNAFLLGNVMPTVEAEWNALKEMEPLISVADCNDMIQMIIKL